MVYHFKHFRVDTAVKLSIFAPQLPQFPRILKKVNLSIWNDSTKQSSEPIHKTYPSNEYKRYFQMTPLGSNSRRGFVCSSFFPSVGHLSPLTSYFYNFGSGWDMFLKSLRGIPGLFLDYFQIISNILYVCQSVGWLTSLLKLHEYGDISSSGRDILLNFFGDIPGMLVH